MSFNIRIAEQVRVLADDEPPRHFVEIGCRSKQNSPTRRKYSIANRGWRLRQSHELQELIPQRAESESPSHCRMLDVLGKNPPCISDLTLGSESGRKTRLHN